MKDKIQQLNQRIDEISDEKLKRQMHIDVLILKTCTSVELINIILNKYKWR